MPDHPALAKLNSMARKVLAVCREHGTISDPGGIAPVISKMTGIHQRILGASLGELAGLHMITCERQMKGNYDHMVKVTYQDPKHWRTEAPDIKQQMLDILAQGDIIDRKADGRSGGQATSILISQLPDNPWGDSYARSKILELINDGKITREMNGKRTYALMLAPQRKTKAQAQAPEPKQATPIAKETQSMAEASATDNILGIIKLQGKPVEIDNLARMANTKAASVRDMLKGMVIEGSIEVLNRKTGILVGLPGQFDATVVQHVEAPAGGTIDAKLAELTAQNEAHLQRIAELESQPVGERGDVTPRAVADELLSLVIDTGELRVELESTAQALVESRNQIIEVKIAAEKEIEEYKALLVEADNAAQNAANQLQAQAVELEEARKAPAAGAPGYSDRDAKVVAGLIDRVQRRKK